MASNGQTAYESYVSHTKWLDHTGHVRTWAGLSSKEQDAWSAASNADVAKLIVTGLGSVIADGDLVPGVGDDTSFGSSPHGTPVSHVFTLVNVGSQPLIVSTPTVPSGYTLTTDPAATLAPGAAAKMVIRWDATAAQVYAGTVSITSNDAGTPYTFGVTGTAS